MNQHLSSDRLEMWIVGQSTADERRHVHACDRCRRQAARFESSVAAFRGAWHAWAESEAVPTFGENPQARGRTDSRRAPSVVRVAWAAAVALLVLATATPLYRLGGDLRFLRPGTAFPTRGEWGIDLADLRELNEGALLMEDIALRLSRTLPAPFDPIVVLIPAPRLLTSSTSSTSEGEIQ